ATAGSELDRLLVSGSATVAGTLRASLINGFSPPFNSSYQVLSAASTAGSFTTVDGQISGTKQFHASVAAAGVKVTAGNVVGTVIPAAGASRSVLPSVPGDGVAIDVFNGIGGGGAPRAADIEALTPTGITLSP